jgi:hypothetical protein
MVEIGMVSRDCRGIEKGAFPIAVTNMIFCHCQRQDHAGGYCQGSEKRSGNYLRITGRKAGELYCRQYPIHVYTRSDARIVDVGHLW